MNTPTEPLLLEALKTQSVKIISQIFWNKFRSGSSKLWSSKNELLQFLSQFTLLLYKQRKLRKCMPEKTCLARKPSKQLTWSQLKLRSTMSNRICKRSSSIWPRCYKCSIVFPANKLGISSADKEVGAVGSVQLARMRRDYFWCRPRLARVEADARSLLTYSAVQLYSGRKWPR